MPEQDNHITAKKQTSPAVGDVYIVQDAFSITEIWLHFRRRINHR